MIKFELLESIDEERCTLKGIVTGNSFEIEDNQLFVRNNDKLTALIVFKDFANSSDDVEEKYHVYI